jgi:hypothetical protein
MMKHNLLKVAAFILAAALVGLAAADRPDDVYVRVDNELLEQTAKEAQVGKTGRELYREQESAHRSITRTTGEEVEHYYVWVCLGKECVPVDPFMASN